MKGITVQTERNYSPGVELQAEDRFEATLTGFKTTVSVELKDWKFRIVGPRYTADIPTCPCSRIPCVTSSWGTECRKANSHARTHCHRASAAHAEHVMVLAEEVLKTYRDKDKVGSRLIGIPHGSDYTRRNGAFLPRPGQEYVTFGEALPGEWYAVCDAAGCRDKEGRVVRLGTHETEHEARSAVERHKAWHAERRGQTYTIPEGIYVYPHQIAEGDWFFGSGGWRRIARKSTCSTLLWVADESRIATLRNQPHLVVRGQDTAPTFTPIWNPRAGRFVEPEVSA